MIVEIGLIVLAAMGGLFWLWGSRAQMPAGKRFVYTHDGYKAVVVVGHDVTCYGNGFIVGGGTDKIEGMRLAESCAIAMKVVNATLRACGPEKPKDDTRVKHCVFIFLGPKAFNHRASTEGQRDEPELIDAYSVQLPRVFKKFGPGPYATVLRSNNMAACADRGQLAIHEMIHIVAHALYRNWDAEHVLWNDPRYFYKGKTLNRIGLDEWRIENTRG